LLVVFRVSPSRADLWVRVALHKEVEDVPLPGREHREVVRGDCRVPAGEVVEHAGATPGLKIASPRATARTARSSSSRSAAFSS
jgi:hypothetical protein